MAAIVNWFKTNIGPSSVPDDLGPALSATGSLPATHRWMNGAYQDHEARAILNRICNQAGVTPPTNAEWAGWTRAQKITWLRSVQNGLRTGFGVWVMLAVNPGQWDSPDDALAAMNLKRIQPSPV